MTRHTWTDRDRQILREHYPHKSTHDVAEMIGVSVKKCYAMANVLGLSKTPAYLNSPNSGRMLKGHRRSTGTEFKPGQIPWNKGKPLNPGGRSVETRFKKGEMSGAAQHNYRPIGSLRITRDGQLERKVSDDPNIYPARRWKPVARLVWEAKHGEIPDGHMVRFKPGMHTTTLAEITLDKLECISKSENMRRNSVHRLPKEVAQVVQLKGALQRQINKRERNAKQNRPSA